MYAYVLCTLCAIMATVNCIPELKLLNVVFAHKTYAPISDLISNNDVDFPRKLTYDYFDTMPLNMPTAGQLNMYNLGVYLRKTYDKFLGDIYTSEVMKMRTADSSLSMMSGQLVNAGLWPPSKIQKWSNEIEWQPIPTDYVTIDQDALLHGMGCPSFASEMRRVLNTAEVKKSLLHHLPLFDYVSHYTGMKIQKPSDVTLLYATLETKADLNQSLPNWANEIFPYGGMYNVTLLEYDLLSHTALQKQLNGGTLIKEVIGNCLKYIQGIISQNRKLMIYSGNDRNVVGVLKNLNLWSPHIPNEAASVIFEMYYDNETDTYSMKVNYYTGTDGDTIPLQIPQCGEMCLLKTFVNQLFEVIPKNEELLCKQRIIDLADNEVYLESAGSHSTLYKPKNMIIFLLVIISLMY